MLCSEYYHEIHISKVSKQLNDCTWNFQRGLIDNELTSNFYDGFFFDDIGCFLPSYFFLNFWVLSHILTLYLRNRDPSFWICDISTALQAYKNIKIGENDKSFDKIYMLTKNQGGLIQKSASTRIIFLILINVLSICKEII